MLGFSEALILASLHMIHELVSASMWHLGLCWRQKILYKPDQKHRLMSPDLRFINFEKSDPACIFLPSYT